MPLFSQRHYNAIARAISEASDCGDASPFVRALSDLFTQDNSAFRPPMFKAACSTNPPPPPTPPRHLYWVASVGRDGLNVTFQRSRGEWLSVCVEVEEGERTGLYDQIVTGWEDVSCT